MNSGHVKRSFLRSLAALVISPAVAGLVQGPLGFDLPMRGYPLLVSIL